MSYLNQSGNNLKHSGFKGHVKQSTEDHHTCHPEKQQSHDDVITWKHFPRYWPFVRGIHRSPVNSPHKGQWRGALMFSLIYARINNRDAGDLRRHRTHYDVIIMNIHYSLCNKEEFGFGRAKGDMTKGMTNMKFQWENSLTCCNATM